MVYRITLIAVAVLLSACSDPKSANEKNFKIAIQKKLDEARPTCYVIANFPGTIPNSLDNDKLSFKALVDAGMLTVKDESRMTTGLMFNKVAVQPVFSLTEEGKKYYKPAMMKSGLGDDFGGFCFGKPIVREIVEFTEPADVMGGRVSQVTYTYELSELPAWAKQPQIVAALPKLKKDVESEKTPIKTRDILVLTNNGWKSDRSGF